MFVLTDDHIKRLITKSAFIGLFILPFACAIITPITYLIFAATSLSIYVKILIAILAFIVTLFLLSMIKARKMRKVKNDVDKVDFIKARLYYSDYFGTTKVFRRGKEYYYLVFKDESGVNRTSQVSKNEYDRLQNKSDREKGVVVLQYLTYDKKKYLYEAYDSNNFVNESSIPLED